MSQPTAFFPGPALPPLEAHMMTRETRDDPAEGAGPRRESGGMSTIHIRYAFDPDALV